MKAVVFAFVLYFLSIGMYADEEPRLQLKVLKHQPCTKGTSHEYIRFPSIEQAPLQEDTERGQGCYSISGNVQVKHSINGTVQVYVETKYGTKAPTEKCTNPDSNGCGGAGSCVYCDACAGIKDLTKSAVKLVVGNKGIDCKKGLKARNYTDIKVTFCMPTKNDFLKSQNIDKEFWDRYGSAGQMVFITMYVFNKPINTLSHKEITKMSYPESDQIIGCHKLVGSIFDPSASSA